MSCSVSLCAYSLQRSTKKLCAYFIQRSTKKDDVCRVVCFGTTDSPLPLVPSKDLRTDNPTEHSSGTTMLQSRCTYHTSTISLPRFCFLVLTPKASLEARVTFRKEQRFSNEPRFFEQTHSRRKSRETHIFTVVLLWHNLLTCRTGKPCVQSGLRARGGRGG